MAKIGFLAVICCALLAGCSSAQARRQIKQAASPSDSYYYDYGNEECYSALDVLGALNATTANLTLFADALYSTGLVEYLGDPTQALTVYAPDDAAIEAAAIKLGMSLDNLLESPQLFVILLYHLVEEPVLTGELSTGDLLPSALGQLLNVTRENMPDSDGDDYTIQLRGSESNATLIDTDYCNCDSCTAVVNVIDTVLLPNITNVTTQGDQTIVTVSNAAGSKEYILIENYGLSPASAPTAAVVSGPTASQAGTPGSSISIAPTSYRAGGTLSTYTSSNQGNLRRLL